MLSRMSALKFWWRKTCYYLMTDALIRLLYNSQALKSKYGRDEWSCREDETCCERHWARKPGWKCHISEERDGMKNNAACILSKKMWAEESWVNICKCDIKNINKDYLYVDTFTHPWGLYKKLCDIWKNPLRNFKPFEKTTYDMSWQHNNKNVNVS